MDRIKLGECFNFNRRRRDIDMSTVPYIIISDFEKSSESDCIKMDNKNEKIYNSLLSKALRAEKTIENSGLSMNLEVPIPPHPNNRDRYILWKKRNVCRHVIEQSEAVIFLERNGYLLDKHYEPYQAIELCKEIKRQKGIKDPVEDKSRNFNNIYNKNDTNILRRKSMYGRESLKIRQKSYNYDEDSDDDFGFPNNRYIHKPSKQLSTASAPAISSFFDLGIPILFGSNSITSFLFVKIKLLPSRDISSFPSKPDIRQTFFFVFLSIKTCLYISKTSFE